MKNIIVFFMAVIMAVGSVQSCVSAAEKNIDNNNKQQINMKIAMISDYSGIADQAFNQAVYEACKTYAQTHETPFICFQPVTNKGDEYSRLVNDALKQGYNVIVAPGTSFIDALKAAAPVNPNVNFIALDIDREYMGDTEIPANLYSTVYQEELSGYMAGYAAVKMGYTKLGYLGGMDIPPVRRYGYGFLQGIDEAAKELKKGDIAVNYIYAGQFESNEKITAEMKKWYQDGIQVVMPCGGLYESVGKATKISNGKIIGIDVDQSHIIDYQYGRGTTVTSAMKDIYGSVLVALFKAENGVLPGGHVERLGLVGEDPEKNYVKLPVGTTQWNDKFTQKDYKILVSKLFNGKLKVSDDVKKSPAEVVNNITVRDLGTIK